MQCCYLFHLYALCLVMFRGYDPESNEKLPQTSQPSSYAAQIFRTLISYDNSSDDNEEPSEFSDGRFNSLETAFRDCTNDNVNKEWDTHARMFCTDQSLEWLARRFVKIAWKLFVKRSLFLTCSGLVGIGPIGTAPGHEICILDQCPQPIILRKCREDLWEHMGTS
ncbi:hypothetical protein BKA67DRAFT_693903 [Truncatella angustata]|uniref:Uncharacterized protein n=1 Tax=Truncatella angustata TaxID=152316 RepID=A0A9P8UEP5_9PEZI|nr:uncharacterized protein BKA67DRAFT_693903 [Truncatella angustata]KAH6648585.1 hypothetical protein BKA67DRAFT_693903 [Truncatella angustata]